MSKFTTLYESILSEIRVGKDSDYDDVFDEFYKKMIDAPTFDYLKRTEQATLRHLGINKSNIEVSDSGNVVVKYAVKGKTLFLIGVLSKKAKLGTEDISDMREWIEKLSKHLMDGNDLITSPNEISEKMLKHVKKTVEKAGMSYHEDELAGNRVELSDSPYLKWKAVRIWAD